MKQIKFNYALIKVFTLITLCITTFGFTSKFGLDSYEIYLNNKLILKRTVNQPVNLRTLQLSEAKQSDQLRINYTHCMSKKGGTGRNIILKNEKGIALKKWAFADDVNMIIVVKELQQLEKANAKDDLSLYYTAHELPKGETLALLK